MQELRDLATFLDMPSVHLSNCGNLAVNVVFTRYARVLAVVVCVFHASIVSVRLNVGSRKQRHVIAHRL